MQASPLQLALSRALAALLPALVFGAAVALLTRPPEAGALSKAAQRMDEALAEAHPDVLLVGNSLVGNGVDEVALLDQMGASDRSAYKLWLAATRPVHWYAWLKNRVYATDLKPELVVIVAKPEMFLFSAALDGTGMRNLADQLGDYEPLITEKISGQESNSLFMHRLKGGRGEAQAGFQSLLREVSVGLLFSGPGDSLRERGRNTAGPALAKVFGGDDAIDMGLHHRAVPVVEQEERDAEVRENTSLEQTFVPDLVQLVHEHGSRLVFVHIPNLDSASEDLSVSPELMASFIELLNAQGVGYVDLHKIGLGPSFFADSSHLNAAGRARFTTALAAELVRIDALSDSPMPAATVPLVLRPTAARTGTPPALPGDLDPPTHKEECLWRIGAPSLEDLSVRALKNRGLPDVSPLTLLEDGQPLIASGAGNAVGKTCQGAFSHMSGQVFFSPTGDDPEDAAKRRYTLAWSEALPATSEDQEAWWLLPGTTLTLSFSDWPAGREALSASVWLAEVRPGKNPPVVEIDGAPVELHAERRWLTGALSTEAPTGPWTITLRSPEDGPMAVVSWLRVGAPRGSVDLIGAPEAVERRTLTLLGTRKVPPKVKGDPPLFPVKDLVAGDPPTLARAPLGPLSALADDGVQATTPCRHCTPLRVLEDGAPLKALQHDCERVISGGESEFCMMNGELILRASDGARPAESGRTYTLGLAEDRRVKDGFWLYPGDSLQYSLPNPPKLLVEGARALRIDGRGLVGAPEDTLSVVVRVGRDVVLRAEVTLQALSEGPVELPFERPLPPDTDDISLKLTSPNTGAFFLLKAVDLTE